MFLVLRRVFLLAARRRATRMWTLRKKNDVGKKGPDENARSSSTRGHDAFIHGRFLWAHAIPARRADGRNLCAEIGG